jgi:hypothetical protein
MINLILSVICRQTLHAVGADFKNRIVQPVMIGRSIRQ